MKKSTLNNILKCILLAIFMCGTITTYAQKKFGGLALYTVRDDMGTNAKATLQAVADAGCTKATPVQ